MKKLSVLMLFIPVLAFSWSKSADEDKMNDQKIVKIYQKSRNTVFAGKTALLAVVINCKTKKTLLMLAHPWVVGSVPVKLRLDKDEPFTLYAEAANDAKVLLIGDSTDDDPNKNPAGTVDRMKKKNNLLIRYGEAGGKTVEAEFTLSGLETQLKNPCK